MASNFDPNAKRNKPKEFGEQWDTSGKPAPSKTAENLIDRADERNTCNKCRSIFRFKSEMLTHACQVNTNSTDSFLKYEDKSTKQSSHHTESKILPLSQNMPDHHSKTTADAGPGEADFVIEKSS